MHGPNFSRMFAEFVELVLPHSVGIQFQSTQIYIFIRNLC
jgi:hypothetical protein